MSQPNASFDELASITIANYGPTIADNVSNNIPLYAMMKDSEGVEEADGGTTLQEALDFGDNPNFKWFTGYEELSLNAHDAIGSANFDWKECNVNIPFSRRQIAINSGAAKRHDLIKSKTVNGERTITNNLGAALFYVGTESDGKALTGLQAMIADDPTTGTYGGINRATAGNEFWRNQVMDENVDSITLSATTIQDGMELLWVRCTRGMDTPTLICFGNTYWRYFAGSVNANSRYIRESDSDTAKTSFPYYVFKTAKVFHDPNAGATRGYFINTRYTKLRPHSERNMKAEKPRYPAGQASLVIPIDFMGNLICRNASLNGVMHP